MSFFSAPRFLLAAILGLGLSSMPLAPAADALAAPAKKGHTKTAPGKAAKSKTAKGAKGKTAKGAAKGKPGVAGKAAKAPKTAKSAVKPSAGATAKKAAKPVPADTAAEPQTADTGTDLTATEFPEDTASGPWIEMFILFVLVLLGAFLVYRRRKGAASGDGSSDKQHQSRAEAAFGSNLGSLDLDKSKAGSSSPLTQTSSKISKLG